MVGNKMVTGNKFIMLNGNVLPYETAKNAAATILVITLMDNILQTLHIFNRLNFLLMPLQKAWKKFTSTKQFRTEGTEEIEFESGSDSSECVNVVRKNMRDYVPPIPISYDSFKSPNVIDVFDQMEMSEGEEIDDH